MAYFLNADLSVKTLGTRLTNPAYAATLTSIASGGADAFYTGAIAQDIVAEIQRDTAGAAAPGALTPGATTLADLAGYQAKKRDPVCIDYRATVVCGMGPPSSGGIAVAQTLGILENFYLAGFGPTAVDLYGGKPSVMGVHLMSARPSAWPMPTATCTWPTPTSCRLPASGVSSTAGQGPTCAAGPT